MEILKTITLYALWAADSVLLIAYPAILVANVMSFAAPSGKREKSFRIWLKTLPFRILLISTTLYPLLLWCCLRLARQSHHGGHFEAAVAWSLPPLFITAVTGWLLFGKPGRSK